MKHLSVLYDEVIDGLHITPQGTYVDATLGGGGHALGICKKLSEQGRLIGFDQDSFALDQAGKRLEETTCQKTMIKDNFVHLKKHLDVLEVTEVNGFLFDLGVSSFQLDDAQRGFSYRANGPLDMRMNEESSLTAADVVNRYSKKALIEILRNFGEERFAKRIAEAIVRKRMEKPFATTLELRDVIEKAYPMKARYKEKHPARKTFQAIRIEVNQELAILEKALSDALDKLIVGGRLAVITFHSLEDRIVKHFFKKMEDPCICPPDFPVCACNRKPTVKIITRKPVTPSEEELNANPRARSAKLRIAEKI